MKQNLSIELNNARLEISSLKEELNKSNKLLFEIIKGLFGMSDCVNGDDYFFAVEVLLTKEVDDWYQENKSKVEAIFEQERLNTIRLNALSKLSLEEKQVLGLS